MVAARICGLVKPNGMAVRAGTGVLVVSELVMLAFSVRVLVAGERQGFGALDLRLALVHPFL